MKQANIWLWQGDSKLLYTFLLISFSEEQVINIPIRTDPRTYTGNGPPPSNRLLITEFINIGKCLFLKKMICNIYWDTKTAIWWHKSWCKFIQVMPCHTFTWTNIFLHQLDPYRQWISIQIQAKTHFIVSSVKYHSFYRSLNDVSDLFFITAWVRHPIGPFAIKPSMKPKR